MTYFVTIIGLSMLILLHEWGHYIVARACGMRVSRFSVGFGPSLFRFERNGTVFQFAAIPLGGYVLIDGMGVPQEEDPADKNPTLASWQAVPTQGSLISTESEQLTDDPSDPALFSNKPLWQRIAVIFAGPAANWLIAAVLIFFMAFSLGFDDGTSTTLGVLSPDGAGAAAGLQVGDKVTHIAAQQVTVWSDLVRVVEAHAGTQVAFQIERAVNKADNTAPDSTIAKIAHQSLHSMTIMVTPQNKGGVGKIGAGNTPHVVKKPLFEALAMGGSGAVKMTQLYARSLWSALFGEGDAKLAGLPGIVKMISSEAQAGARRFFHTLAWLSIGLFILNLAPFPALDGGRLMFLAIESIRGKPVDAKLEGIVHTVGFVLLFSMIIVVSIRDIIAW